MILFPHAKLNLGLNVVRKRSDGFHDIETVFFPIPIRDALEALVDHEIAPGEVRYSRSGLAVDGAPQMDLVMRAHRLVGQSKPLPGLRMHLHKSIPMGAGLGGGSSDATHTLLLLDALLGLELPQEKMRAMALNLGSDCPYFLKYGTYAATGRGEKLEPIDLTLEGSWLVVVNPAIHIPTADVFKQTTPSGSETGFPRVLGSVPIEDWNLAAPNHMELAVFRKWPEVRLVRDRLKESGAAHAAMSGSGSTVFGIFRTPPPAIQWPAHYRAWTFLADQPVD